MMNVLIEYANYAGNQWAAWVLAALLDSAALLVLIGLVWFAIRGRVSPQVGYCLFLLVPLKLLSPVGVTVPAAIAQWTPSASVSRWFDGNQLTKSLEIQPPAPTQIAAVRTDGHASSEARIESPAPSQPVMANSHQQDLPTEARSRRETASNAGEAAHPLTRAHHLSVSGMAMILWFMGVLLLLGRLVWIQLRFRARLQHHSPVDESRLAVKLSELCRRTGVTQTVRVIESEDITVPAVWGIARPTIILPRAIASSLTAEQLQWVLLHELAHIRRRDLLVVVLQRCAAILHFFNPAVWIANRIINRLREYACDDVAVSMSDGSAVEFGQAFMQILKHASRSHRGLDGALGIFGLDSRASCFLRVRRLLDSERPIRTRLGAWSLCGLVLFAAAALPQLRAASDAAKPDPPAADNKAATPNQPKPKISANAEVNIEALGQNTPDEGTVTGVLVKASDKSPVAGARVILRSSQKYVAESDAAGRFRLEKIPVDPRGYEILAHQANLVTQKTPVRQLQTADADVARFAPLRLEMVEGRQAKFIITSKITGQPIPGAVVRFGYPDRRTAETDRDGTAVVMGLLSQEYDVTIEADEHARAAPKIDLSHAAQVSEYKVLLVQGGIVQGVVVDEAGEPVPEAEVVYRESTGSGYYGDAYRTDAEGHFRHRFLPMNKPITVSVRNDRYIAQEKDVVLTAGQPKMDMRIALVRRPRGGSIAGTVTDQGGRPVAGVRVANYGNRSDPHVSTTTDAQGQFVLEDLTKGSADYEIAISAKGFAPQRMSVQTGTGEHPGTVTVKLEPGHAIHGQVVDELGKPMPQAFVSVRSGVYPPGGLGNTISTNEEGRFAFDSIPADARFDVSLPSYPLLFNIPLKLDSDDPITVTLKSPGTVHGIVVDAESRQPLPQFRVRLSLSREKQPNDPQGTFSSELEHGVTFKSDTGRFTVGPLTNGMPVELTIEAEGYERSVVPRAVAAKANKGDDFKITLKRIDVSGLFSLRGEVLDYEGKGASGAQLRLIVSPEQPLGMNDNNFNWGLIKNGQLAQKSYCEQFLSLTTDAQGRFEFQDVRPGKYLQLAYWGDGVPQGRSLAFDKTRPGKSDKVTIKLPQPAQIHGTFDRSNFSDAGSIRLSRSQEAWHDYEIKLNDDQATFEFRDLPPGNYSLVVAAKPVRYSENGTTFFKISPLAGQQFQLTAGESKDVHFTKPDKTN